MEVNHEIYGGIVQLSGNRVEVEVTIDTPTGDSPRALLKATSTDNAIKGGPWVDSKPWTIQQDNSGKAIFDFSEYFDAPVDYGFTYPYGESVAVKHPLRAFDLSILAGCSYIDNDITHITPDVPETNTYGKKIELWQAVENAVAIRILKGGLSQQRQSEYNEAATNFYIDYIVGNKFLTNRPNNQRIAYTQPLRLWYLLPETNPQTRQLVIEYIDSAGAPHSIIYDITLDPDGIYEFVLDPVKHGIPSDAISMSVYQSVADVQLGEKRTFIFDHTWYENNTFLMFSNSLSGIDDLWLSGAVKLGNSMESTTGMQSLDRSATTRDRGIVVTGKKGKRKWSVYPGNRFLVTDMEYLQDLFYSKNIWLIWNGSVIPVTIEDADRELTDTMRDLVINDELELVFTEANENNHF